MGGKTCNPEQIAGTASDFSTLLSSFNLIPDIELGVGMLKSQAVEILQVTICEVSPSLKSYQNGACLGGSVS